MPDQFLAIADADKIHDYVFSPHELKMIRGGSALQAQLNEDETATIISQCHGKKIYAGGGAALARFEEQPAAARFCQEIEELYRARTHIATASTAWIQYPEGGFHETRKRLAALLERRKNSCSHHRFNSGGPFWVSCQACGLDAASHPGSDKLLCRACEIREGNSDRSRHLPEKIKAAKDFEKIASVSRPLGYLAVVYIDVDRLGRMLDEHRTEESFRDFCEAVKDAVGSVRSALESLLIHKKQAYYETLLLGGDDAIVALPAQHVFEFLRRFQDFFRKQLPPQVTFSAGVVFANHHFPIAEFVRVAEVLLRRAKERVPNENAVDFEVITSSVSGTNEEVRRLEPTAKPYTLEDFLEMEREIREEKTVGTPTSKVKALYEIGCTTPE